MKISTISIIISIFGAFVHASYRAASTTAAAQIRFLLDEEKMLREKLDARVLKLRQRAGSLNQTIVPCTCALPKPSTSRQVAYTGTIGTNALSSLTPNTVFNFTYDLQNFGGAFNPSDGHFVAPVDGLYGFSLTVYVPVSNLIKMELVANGRPILNVQTAHINSGGYNRQENMATNFAVVNITKGTEVWPRYISGSATLYGNGVPTFSGFLLHEL